MFQTTVLIGLSWTSLVATSDCKEDLYLQACDKKLVNLFIGLKPEQECLSHTGKKISPSMASIVIQVQTFKQLRLIESG